MSLRELLAGGGGVKSIQSGYVSTTSMSEGSGEDISYLDVSISSVDPTKCVVFFDGSGGNTTTDVSGSYAQGTTATRVVTSRMTSATNLRLSHIQPSSGTIKGRWQVVEYK